MLFSTLFAPLYLGVTFAGFAHAAPASSSSSSHSLGPNPGYEAKPKAISAGANPDLAGKNTSFGLNPNSSLFVKDPVYQTFSDFDFQSIALATHQEYIELDLFNYGIARFSAEEFKSQGISENDIELLRFFAQQEIGHANLLSNMLGPHAPKQCKYQYPFNNVSEYIDFSQKLTRFGESGVYGFLNLLDNRAVGQNLLQSITTEARQQYTFRQWEGINSINVWFETGIPQTYAWTLLSQYIASCPDQNLALGWQIFPHLDITNNPSAIGPGLAAGGAAISHNISALLHDGDVLEFKYDQPGKTQGPYGQKTMAGLHTHGDSPRYAAFFSQLNVTYSDLYDVQNGTAKTKVPLGGNVLPVGNEGIINGTMFVSLTSERPYLTTANTTLINAYTVAGPALLQAG